MAVRLTCSECGTQGEREGRRNAICPKCGNIWGAEFGDKHAPPRATVGRHQCRCHTTDAINCPVCSKPCHCEDGNNLPFKTTKTTIFIMGAMPQ